MSKKRSLALGAIIVSALLAIPLTSQRSRINELEGQLAEAGQRPEEAGQKLRSQIGSKRAGEDTIQAAEMEISAALHRMAQIYTQWNERDQDEVKSLEKLLDETPLAELFAACRAIEEPKQRGGCANFLVHYLGASKPLECIEFARGEPAKTQSELMHTLFLTWTQSAPDDAANWFLENQDEKGDLLGTTKTRDFFSDFIAFSLGRAGRNDSAIEFVGKLQGRQRKAAALHGFLGRAKASDLEAIGTELLSKSDDALVRKIAMEKIGELLTNTDIDAGKEWVARLRDSGDQSALDAATEGVAVSWMRSSPGEEAAQWWMENRRSGNREHAYADIVEHWAKSAPNACGEWLGAQTPSEPLDLAKAVFARAVFAADPESAKAWAASIEDGAMRDSLARELR